LEEMAERAAETIPGLMALAKLQAVVGHEKLQTDVRRRTQDGHVAQMRAVGMNDVKTPTPEEDDMARYTICGDVYGDAAARQVFGEGEAESQPPPSSVTPKPAARRALAKAVIVAALVGLSVGWVARMFAPQPPAVEAPVDTTNQIEIE
jgi:hypothetical protein